MSKWAIGRKPGLWKDNNEETFKHRWNDSEDSHQHLPIHASPLNCPTLVGFHSGDASVITIFPSPPFLVSKGDLWMRSRVMASGLKPSPERTAAAHCDKPPWPLFLMPCSLSLSPSPALSDCKGISEGLRLRTHQPRIARADLVFAKRGGTA